jgi:uncharacterized Tic20 family protein
MAEAFPFPGSPHEEDSSPEQLAEAEGFGAIPSESSAEETQPDFVTEAVEEPAEIPPSPPPASRTYSPPSALSAQEERTWAMLAHLSILLNLVTGFFGPIAALIIYLIYQDRSRYVAYHAMQSFVFQLVAWIGAGILAGIAWTISGILTVVLIGCLLMPIALLISLIPLGALIYGIIGAIEVNQGKDFRYWLVGDWVRGTLTR